jgi:hypothetical protein
MRIKEKWFVDLDIQNAKRENPGDKRTHLSAHFDSPNQDILDLIKVQNYGHKPKKNHIYCKMTLSEKYATKKQL